MLIVSDHRNEEVAMVKARRRVQRRIDEQGKGRTAPAARTPLPNNDPLLTEVEAADWLAWTTRALQRRRWLGLPPRFVKVGRSVRYRLSDVESFVQDGGGDAPAT
jgi:hypothetical protein